METSEDVLERPPPPLLVLPAWETEPGWRRRGLYLGASLYGTEEEGRMGIVRMAQRERERRMQREKGRERAALFPHPRLSRYYIYYTIYCDARGGNFLRV